MMLNAILDYVEEYPGRVVVPNDNPQDLYYGFTLRDVDPFLLNRPTWRIRCKDLRDSALTGFHPDEIRKKILLDFQTAQGRIGVARALTLGRKQPSEDLQTRLL